MRVHVHIHALLMCMSAPSAFRSHRRMDPGIGVTNIVSCFVGGGIELRSSGRTASALNH